MDQNGRLVGTSLKSQDSFIVLNPKLWWPKYFGSENYGYMYTLKVWILFYDLILI